VEAAGLPWGGIDARVRLVLPNNQGKGPLSFLLPDRTEEETFDKVSIWIELTSDIGIEIPLVKDHLAIDNAILPRRVQHFINPLSADTLRPFDQESLRCSKP